MNEPGYRIAIDPKRSLLRLTFTGLWTADTADGFEQELDGARREMIRQGVSPDWRFVLVDIRNYHVQTQDVAARVEARVVKHHTDERRVAIVVGPTQLQKMQAGRVAAIEQHRLFPSEEEAMAWLFGRSEAGNAAQERRW